MDTTIENDIALKAIDALNMNIELLKQQLEEDKFNLNTLQQQLEQEKINYQKCQQQLEQEQINYKNFLKQLEQAQHDLEQERIQHQSTQKLLEQEKYSMNYILSSRSWKITQPLRTILQTMHKVSKNKRIFNRYFESPVQEKIQSLRMNNEIKPEFNKIFDGTMFIFAGVPLSDVGGGQRSAQLAKCAALAGIEVIYIYAYPSYSFKEKRFIECHAQIPGITSKNIDTISATEIFAQVSKQSVILFELPHPKFLPFMHQANQLGLNTCFELIDDWETSLGGEWFSPQIYREFVKTARTVTATATILKERLVQLGRTDVLLMPNGANELLFNKYCRWEKPKEFNTDKAKGVYVGSLYGEWFSWEHVIVAAKENENIEFFLIGDYSGCFSSDNVLPKNIIMLGEKSIETIPAYLYHADFAMVPFKPSKIVDATSPIKAFEYLFMEKPVISTRIKEIVGFPGVMIADNVEEFSQYCRLAVKQNISKKENDLFIAQHSWFKKIEQLMKIEGEKNISIIILCLNNIEIIDRCLHTLKNNCMSYIKEIIVVDNGSNDGSVDFIQTYFQDVILIKNKINGCSSGRNLGLKIATGEYIAFFDSDQWMTSGLGFKRALSVLKNSQQVGCIGWAAGWFISRNNLGSLVTCYLPERGMTGEARYQGFRKDIHYLGTGGFFIKRSLINKIGGFDEKYDPTCFEDTDLSFKIKKIGYDLAYSNLIGIMHQPHQTTKANINNDNYQKLFKKNHDYFLNKWKKQLKPLSFIES